MRSWGLLTWLVDPCWLQHRPAKTKTYRQEPFFRSRRTRQMGVPTEKRNAPVRSTAFAYDVFSPGGGYCAVGRYQSATDYLPSTWTEGNSVEVSIDKHRMYLKGSSAEDFRIAYCESSSRA